MDHYVDIRVEPDLEISAPALLNNLFAKFHRTAAQIIKGQIGVSFPKYGQTLGEVLRLHGSQQALDLLMAQPWLKGLRDYTQVTEVQPIPQTIQGYRTVCRIQKKSPQNIRKRAVAKGWLTEQQALAKIPDAQQQMLTLPFLQLQSLSSKSMMRVYIQQGEITQQAVTGEFSSYGLSRSATIPWF